MFAALKLFTNTVIIVIFQKLGKFLYISGRIRPVPARIVGPMLQPVDGCQVTYITVLFHSILVNAKKSEETQNRYYGQ